MFRSSKKKKPFIRTMIQPLVNKSKEEMKEVGVNQVLSDLKQDSKKDTISGDKARETLIVLKKEGIKKINHKYQRDTIP
jgi:hypothetical protein